MKITDVPYGIVDWSKVEPTEHRGDSGTASWRTKDVGAFRIRMVEYSPGYSADHWCDKGHIVLCVEGELFTQLEDGRSFVLRPGMTYHVSDHAERHRSSTTTGAKLFIVD